MAGGWGLASSFRCDGLEASQGGWPFACGWPAHTRNKPQHHVTTNSNSGLAHLPLFKPDVTPWALRAPMASPGLLSTRRHLPLFRYPILKRPNRSPANVCPWGRGAALSGLSPRPTPHWHPSHASPRDDLVARTAPLSLPRQAHVNLDSAPSIASMLLPPKNLFSANAESCLSDFYMGPSPVRGNDCAHMFPIKFSHSANLACVVWAWTGYGVLRFILTGFGAQTSGRANTGPRFRV